MTQITLGPKWAEYLSCKTKREEAEKWAALIGKSGQGGNILIYSSAHSKVVLTLAGQLYEGGQNYWESPKSFNEALITVIKTHRKALTEEALALLLFAEQKALVAAREEIESVMKQINEIAP